MNRIKTFISIAAFSLLVLGIPAIASAQYYPDDRYGNDRYGRNDRYGNDRYGRNDPYDNGRYGGNYDVRGRLRAFKNHVRQFERMVDRELDRGRWNGSRREDQINDLTRRFARAVNNLNERDLRDRRDNDVRRVTDLASQLDRELSRARVSHQIQNHWSLIRREMRDMGIYYGYNDRNPRQSRLPSWWPF